MALRATLDNDQNEQRLKFWRKKTSSLHCAGNWGRVCARNSDDAQNAERCSMMPARIGLAQSSRRLPIAAILRGAATIASQYEISAVRKW